MLLSDLHIYFENENFKNIREISDNITTGMTRYRINTH